MTALPPAPHPVAEGQRLGALELPTLSHGLLKLPTGGLVHLQFRRFAGCPICNLHVRAFSQQHARLLEAKVQTVAFFHSSAEVMRPLQGDLPFPVVADPEKTWYRHFGVEQSLLGAMHPRAMWAAMQGLVLTRANLKGEGGSSGLPADFLVDGEGVVRAAHYGTHADDSWSVDDVLARAGR